MKTETRSHCCWTVSSSFHHEWKQVHWHTKGRQRPLGSKDDKDTPVGLLCPPCHPLSINWALKENENGILAFIGDLRMTNTTFPVFLMDNIRLVSRERDSCLLASQRNWLSENWLSQCTSLFFLFLFEFSSPSRIHRTCYLRQWLISIRTLGQGALL